MSQITSVIIQRIRLTKIKINFVWVNFQKHLRYPSNIHPLNASYKLHPHITNRNKINQVSKRHLSFSHLLQTYRQMYICKRTFIHSSRNTSHLYKIRALYSHEIQSLIWKCNFIQLLTRWSKPHPRCFLLP